MKKVFSVHLTKENYDYLVDKLGVETSVEMSRYCSSALKTSLLCKNPIECAKRISELPVDWSRQLESPRVVVSSSKCEREAIDLAAKELVVSTNQICSVLVNHAIYQSKSPAENQRKTQLVKFIEPNIGMNDGQSKLSDWLYSNGWTTASKDKPQVFYSELGTGTGKTLLALLVARASAKAGQRTWIAVPSLSVQKQFIAEYEKWFGKRTKLLITPVAGRAEFVSECRLISLLEYELSGKNPGNWIDPARRWIDRVADKPFGIDRRRWLLDSFLNEVPGFPFATTEICVTVDCLDDDAGAMAYSDQFLIADRAEIVVLTHHYLALETMSRVKAGLAVLRDNENAQSLLKALMGDPFSRGKIGSKMTRSELFEMIDQKNYITSMLYDPNEMGKLVLPQRLIVDEAHLLEENFSRATTITIAVRRIPGLFQSLVREKKIKSETPSNMLGKRIERLCTQLGEVNLTNGRDQLFLNTGTREQGVEPKTFATIDDLASVFSEFAINGKGEEVSALKRIQYALRRMASGSKFSLGIFTNSPVRQYPQIIFGNTSHRAEFRLLFKNLGIEATLFLSATIYLPTIGGTWSPGRFLRDLGLETSDAKGYRADIEKWSVDPVTLYWPPKPSDVSKNNGPNLAFLYPGNEEPLQGTWLKQSATMCAWVQKTAKGGTLVLMTSYQSAEMLSKEILKRSPELSSVLLVSNSKSGGSIAELKAKFIDIYCSGRKPIWIAVGACWTGLNLSLGEAGSDKQDNLLTDLVIPRTPYSLNKTISSAAKGQTAARHIQSLEEAGMMLKQGVGRLIRSINTLPNRRLFFLDSRIYDKDKRTLLNMATALLRPYKNVGSLPKSLIKEILASTPLTERTGKSGRVASAGTQKNTLGYKKGNTLQSVKELSLDQKKSKLTDVDKSPALITSPPPGKKTFGAGRKLASDI